jgi:hypothetical protein
MQGQVEIKLAEPGAEVLFVATFLPLRRWRKVMPFLLLNVGIERQLKRSPGLLRYGLKTNLPRKQFWTVSVWTDKAAADAFVRNEPQAAAIRRFQDRAGSGEAFVEWRSRRGEIED